MKILLIILTGQLMAWLPLKAQDTLLPDFIISAPVRVANGFSFTEGSSVADDGRVYFTDQPNDKIYVWHEENGISLFKEGTERSNGTYFDKNGGLIACADLQNRLIRFNTDGSFSVIYEGGFEGKYLNGPNDIWIDHKGGIYITDPYYYRNYWEAGHKQMMEIEGVYYLSSSGTLIRVIDDLKKPNGIVGSPDGKFLYVSDIKDQKTWKYEINTDGTLGQRIFFAAVGSDGIALDNQGNLYLTSGKVIIVNSSGIKTGEITLPEAPSNLCFGGKDKNILFITARTSVYVVQTRVRGVE
jgi:gluconolactonase